MRYFVIVIIVLLASSCSNTDNQGNGTEQVMEDTGTSAALPEFDNFWNFEDLAGTEVRFRQILPRARQLEKTAYVAELLTQIGRAQGLQQRYPEALATLNEADAIIQPEMKTAHVRSLLERGRVLNSSGKAEESVPVFQQALDAGRDAGLEFYAVDAAHMLGIATKARESLKWNEEAIRMAETAKDVRARRWLGPLYNNTGWTYFDMGRYEDALRLFEKDLAFRKEANSPVEIGIARWNIAKMHRHLGRVEQSLNLQLDLLNLPERKNNDAEGYTREEIAECLVILGRGEEAVPYFSRAWELLHEDPWLRQDEPERLERLKRLGAVQRD